jgi:hypothetical protein
MLCPQSSTLMAPFMGTKLQIDDPPKDWVNSWHSRVRITIECCFGMFMQPRGIFWNHSRRFEKRRWYYSCSLIFGLFSCIGLWYVQWPNNPWVLLRWKPCALSSQNYHNTFSSSYMHDFLWPHHECCHMQWCSQILSKMRPPPKTIKRAARREAAEIISDPSAIETLALPKSTVFRIFLVPYCILFEN